MITFRDYGLEKSDPLNFTTFRFKVKVDEKTGEEKTTKSAQRYYSTLEAALNGLYKTLKKDMFDDKKTIKDAVEQIELLNTDMVSFLSKFNAKELLEETQRVA